MSFTDKLHFTQKQLHRFAKIFKAARAASGMTQLQVANTAFSYRISHCKVSRVERCAMPKVDALCLEMMAQTLQVPLSTLEKVDPKFRSRVVIAREATRRGFWDREAAML